ncbi:MAG TPA: dTMP kinase [Elusimicrobia bacterium]|nr:MAG: dTMP kinase [Elusimicrobia bacterium RIFOXYA12_FULL_49_49]OGS14781.1 MAG: dTMP kinase [Elusimicrobia bacterium RIFOXYA2_FULL_47_53]OGS25569.1 MAG: dTMP kinase [Elusimicrobia bacterium RIFOXYB12_FULL_50_12]OGS28935.1 MAG: dTMP kinase [Elusimicrobia bacterium RIFOXYB2_FULL_46_23]HBU68779.1 dTMP kinase [Elusimicrobiota bacterium]
MKKNKKGFFITFEGPEGGGKSTHCELLSRYLHGCGFSVVRTREPGGTKLAEDIRQVLLNPKNSITPLAELMLYEASRAQHTQELIIPALNNGKTVICDRYTDATLAYQGYGRKLDIPTIKKLNSIATCGISPDLTIVLDTPVERGLALARGIKKESFEASDRIERENFDFHRTVRAAYLKIAKLEPKRIKVVRTAETVEDTQDKIRQIVKKALKL